MSDLAGALKTFTAFLEGRRVPYMIIGGIANLVWGVPRATLDIDVTVWAPRSSEGRLIRAFVKVFVAKPADPGAFVSEMRVLPIKVEDVDVDVIFGHLPYDRSAIGRAVAVDFLGVKARVCTPEDLILHKIVSSRPKDRQDVAGVIRARAKKLDREFLDPKVKELAEALAQPEIWDYYLSCWPRLVS